MAAEDAREVASYVLAYLLQNNYRGTANAFLQECNVLPSKTFIQVLPETPLHTIIEEHKARHNAKVLVNTLGSEPAWLELWCKLQTTLNQIRCLSEDLNSHRFQPVAKKRVHKIATESAKSCRQHKIAAESVKSCRQTKVTGKQLSDSPRKRKQGLCKRIQQSSPTLSPSAATSPQSSPLVGTEAPNSPTIQHVLDTFLDDSFPGKLADIINQCVSSDMCTADMSSEMSSETLERILNVTLSEPMLESKAASVESTTLSELAIQKHSDQPCQPAVTTSGNSGGSDYKKPKLNQTEQTSSVLSFSSEQDIDNFLDQIHQ